MRSTVDPIKLLARRFASLPPLVRIKITEKLLRWRDENQEAQAADKQSFSCSSSRRKSMVEQFWDEVEAAHGDGLYPTNPFSDERSQLLPFAMKDSPERCLAYN
ncbi:MAG TPA: hypothetical protein VF528_02595 [Pyrinomonadaceae bacterium]|jgi:hypothetical protein